MSTWSLLLPWAGVTPAEAKKRLRAEVRRRPAPTPGESEKVCEQVLAWLRARRPAPTLVWMAMPGELDLSPVVKALSEIEWLTTRTPSSGPLTVHPYHSEGERHRFGFHQPVAWAPEIPPARIGVVLAPALTFDRQGRRLGWGMGYYDRLLARLAHRAPRVGVTLDRLITESIPREPHDIPMTHLITDRGVTEIV